MPHRPRDLRKALETIEKHGGIGGTHDAAERLMVDGANLRKWEKVEPWKMISKHIPVFLMWDVEQRRKSLRPHILERRQAKARKGEQ